MSAKPAVYSKLLLNIAEKRRSKKT